MKHKLVIFDMDGVIFKGKNFWLELHHEYGTVSIGLRLAELYLKKDYDLLVKHVAGTLWKGKDAFPYYRLIAKRQYQPDIEEVFDFLHKYKIYSAIISTGPYDLAMRAQRKLGIDRIYANKLIIKNGKIEGNVDVMVKDNEKAIIGRKLINHYGLKPSQVAFIGDGDNDIGLASLVGLPIAYNSRLDSLKRKSKYILYYGELRQLIYLFQ